MEVFLELPVCEGSFNIEPWQGVSKAGSHPHGMACAFFEKVTVA